MDKYNGIKVVKIASEKEIFDSGLAVSGTHVLSGAPDGGSYIKLRISELEEEYKRKPRIFLWQLIICGVFLAAFALLNLVSNDTVQMILNNIKQTVCLDLLGTHSSDCIINIWLSKIL